MFTELEIKRCYRSKQDNLDGDLIVPLLKESVQYDRGTGFFSLAVLSNLSEGLIPYIKRGGNIRVITSVELDPSDINTFEKGVALAESKIEKELLRIIDEKIEEKEIIDLDLITNLIAAGRLQIKIAYLLDGGIYHEKIGYLKDLDGNSVWFAGSTNETYSGYKKNIESLMVLKSWCGDAEEINEQCEYFSSLWAGIDPNIQIMDMPYLVKNRLIENFKKSENVEAAIALKERYILELSN